MNADTTPRQEGFMDRIKESPRTVSALIIILIVAAAIYAFSGKPQNQPTNSESPGATNEATETEEGGAGDAAEPTASGAATPKATATPVAEATQTDQGYEEVAQAGDGTTHLARRAVDRWLADNQPGYTVQKEHRIYMEDYIRKHLPVKRLGIGQKQLITFDLVKEAAAKAQGLSDTQLKHLSQYTSALP